MFYNFIFADNFIVKKIFFLILNICLLFNSIYSQTQEVQIPKADALIFSNEVPRILDGIWEGDDRILMFQEKQELEKILSKQIPLEEKKYIWCYLKTFYGWYLDRAAEKNNRQNSEYQYDKNNTVFLDIQNIQIQFKKLIQEENCCAYELILSYPKSKTKSIIPIAIVDDKIYLDFAIKNKLPQNSTFENSVYYGSWSRVAKVSGIKISEPIIDDELVSMFITENSIYKIRYWKTDMEFSNDFATFSDGEKKYEVPKHIFSCGNVYTCTTGRSLVIRNIEKQNIDNEFLKNELIINEQQNVLAFGKPYLIQKSKDCSLINMMQIVKLNNLQKAPYPDPPFEPSDLDWHLDDINRLEINNQIIQAVRQRQREFYQKYGHGLKF